MHFADFAIQAKAFEPARDQSAQAAVRNLATRYAVLVCFSFLFHSGFIAFYPGVIKATSGKYVP
jgi:hypothetical protein